MRLSSFRGIVVLYNIGCVPVRPEPLCGVWWCVFEHGSLWVDKEMGRWHDGCGGRGGCLRNAIRLLCRCWCLHSVSACVSQCGMTYDKQCIWFCSIMSLSKNKSHRMCSQEGGERVCKCVNLPLSRDLHMCLSLSVCVLVGCGISLFCLWLRLTSSQSVDR